MNANSPYGRRVAGNDSGGSVEVEPKVAGRVDNYYVRSFEMCFQRRGFEVYEVHETAVMVPFERR